MPSANKTQTQKAAPKFGQTKPQCYKPYNVKSNFSFHRSKWDVEDWVDCIEESFNEFWTTNLSDARKVRSSRKDKERENEIEEIDKWLEAFYQDRKGKARPKDIEAVPDLPPADAEQMILSWNEQVMVGTKSQYEAYFPERRGIQGRLFAGTEPYGKITNERFDLE